MMKDRKPHIQEELRSPGPTTGKKTTFPPNPVKLLKTKEKILEAATGKKPCSPPKAGGGAGSSQHQRRIPANRGLDVQRQ